MFGTVPGSALRAGPDPPPVAAGQRFVEGALAGQRAAHEDHPQGRLGLVKPAPAVGYHGGEIVQHRDRACLGGRGQGSRHGTKVRQRRRQLAQLRVHLGTVGPQDLIDRCWALRSERQLPDALGIEPGCRHIRRRYARTRGARAAPP